MILIQKLSCLILALTLVGLISPLHSARASGFDDYLLSFATTDCEGRSGLGVIKISDLKRIDPFTCSNGKETAKLYAKGDGKTDMLTFFMISNEEVKNIQQEVSTWQAAKRHEMMRSDKLIIQTK